LLKLGFGLFAGSSSAYVYAQPRKLKAAAGSIRWLEMDALQRFPAHPAGLGARAHPGYPGWGPPDRPGLRGPALVADRLAGV